MKKLLMSTVIAAQCLGFSAFVQAEEVGAPLAAPMLLSAAQMDKVTAGAATRGSFTSSWLSSLQFNVSPVTVVQVSVLNFGGSFNLADIWSGNILQGMFR